jgi:hypothetical protein
VPFVPKRLRERLANLRFVVDEKDRSARQRVDSRSVRSGR